MISSVGEFVSVFSSVYWFGSFATHRHARGCVDAGSSAPDVPAENIFGRRVFIPRNPQGRFLRRIFCATAGEWKIAHAVKG
jgi:hypothetical protein